MMHLFVKKNLITLIRHKWQKTLLDLSESIWLDVGQVRKTTTFIWSGKIIMIFNENVMIIINVLIFWPGRQSGRNKHHEPKLLKDYMFKLFSQTQTSGTRLRRQNKISLLISLLLTWVSQLQFVSVYPTCLSPDVFLLLTNSWSRLGVCFLSV